jgi:TolB-like protein/Flp pilus assembly protein TadD
MLILTAFVAYRTRVPATPGAVDLSIAVLPFLSFTAGQANDDFANGLTEEITDVLTKSGNFRVLGRSAARQVYSRAEPVPSIGKLLNVSAVLEGSVRRDGDKVRITAQLIDTANGYHRWSETFERDMGDAFRLQAEISAVIGESIRSRMPGISQRPVSAEVQDLLDRGWFQLEGTEEERRAIFKGRASLRPDRSVEQLLQSVRFFEQATSLAPNFAPGWSGLSMAYFEMTDYDPRIASKARDAANEALRRDRNDSDAHAVLGRISFFWDWNFRQAASEFRQALDSNPRNPRICRWYADSLVLSGNAQDALAELRRAERLVPGSGEIAFQHAVTLYNAREYQRAIDQAQKALALEPRSPLPHWITGLAHEQLRRYPQALASFEQALRISPDDPRANPAIAHLYAVEGKPEPARRILDDLRSRRPGERSAPFSIALIYAGLGDTQAALDWLDRAWQQHDTSLPYALVDPRLDGLRQHPRFRDLARRLRK